MQTPRLVLFVSILTLASLACNAFVSTVERVAGGAAATQTPPTSPPPSAAAPGEDLRLEGGPVILAPAAAQELLRQQGDQLQFLEAYAQEQYTPEELSQAGRTYDFTVQLGGETTALWGTNWCTTTPVLLEDNWDDMGLQFIVNDTEIPVEQFLVADLPSGNNLVCRHYLTVVSDWPAGTTTLETRVTFKKAVNDGLSDYPAGTHVYRYTVSLP